MSFIKTKHKNIIFDLGGVLLNLDYNLTTNAFRASNPSFHSLDAVYSNSDNKKLFEDYEKGMISSTQFRDGIRNILSKPDLSDTSIDLSWNAMLLDLPNERVQLLERLKKDHSLFLLSNSNEIHIDAYLKDLKANHGLKDLSHIFKREYYSYQIHLRKPDKEIFEFVIKENGLIANETFFIDDSMHHIKGANSVGIDAYFLQKNETILDVFK